MWASSGMVCLKRMVMLRFSVLNLLRGMARSLIPWWESAIAPMLLYSFSIGARMRAMIREQGRDARGECGCAECDQVIVKIAQFGDDDGGFDANLRAAPCEAFGGAFTLAVVIAGMTRRAMPGGGAKAPSFRLKARPRR